MTASDDDDSYHPSKAVRAELPSDDGLQIFAEPAINEGSEAHLSINYNDSSGETNLFGPDIIDPA